MARKEDYSEQKADLLQRINERASKWLDQVMYESINLDDGEYAEIKFTVGKAGHGPEPKEEQLFALSVEETRVEHNV
jgi:hypothetical protein